MTELVLGTAQLSGFIYGGLTAPLDRRQSYAILDAAWDSGVRAFDTAESYGASAPRLEAWLTHAHHWGEAHISTKVTLGGGLHKRTTGALQRFGQAKSVLLLSHGAASTADWWTLQAVTGNWDRVTCGQSVYTPEEIDAAISMGVTHLQVPAHIRDTWAFVARGVAPTRFDVRSVFGCGTLLADYAPIMLLLGIQTLLRDTDRIVVGVDCPEQICEVADIVRGVPREPKVP